MTVSALLVEGEKVVRRRQIKAWQRREKISFLEVGRRRPTSEAMFSLSFDSEYQVKAVDAKGTATSESWRACCRRAYIKLSARKEVLS